MIHPLPDFPPLFPPGKWWRIYLNHLLEGAPEKEAVDRANRISCMKAREWMRIRIAGDSLLSFPVKGGASALKNHPSESWLMARECEREIIRYASTLATVYGRTPYFHLLKDVLIPEAVPDIPAEVVAWKCHRTVRDVILPDKENFLHSLKKALNAHNERIKEIFSEFNISFNSELSIIDALVRWGPDAIFPLVPAF